MINVPLVLVAILNLLSAMGIKDPLIVLPINVVIDGYVPRYWVFLVESYISLIYDAGYTVGAYIWAVPLLHTNKRSL